MGITSLWLTDFRCFEESVFEPDPRGLTVLRGENGAGKTSVLEAVGWLAVQRSFRGAGREALVRTGAARAIVRAQAVGERSGRNLLLEAEIPLSGATRTQVNRQPVRRRADLSDALRVSVFSPDDLEMVQGAPAFRRTFLDDTLVNRNARADVIVTDVDRILRQRAAVLRQASGRPGDDIIATLDVWDARLAAAGEELAEARSMLCAELGPGVSEAYRSLAGSGEEVTLSYRCSWTGSLAEALARARPDDLRRQVSTVGPHRDDLEVSIDGRPTRTHASQGEQRSVALALRLAAHHLATATHGEAPVLLLDDVFSELDAHRAASLVEQLPSGQVLLTTAVDPPPVVSADRVVEVARGRVLGAAGAP